MNFTTFFKGKKKRVREYEGFSDFVLHATPEEKKEVFTEAAKRANDDQLRIFKEAEMKLKAN